MSRPSKFDAAQSITNELIALLSKGTLPWRRPWRVPGAQLPLRHTGEPYQGVNNFLLTLRTNLAGYGSPYWMTLRQANELGGRIRKGEKSSVVVYYGTSHKHGGEQGEAKNDTPTEAEPDPFYRFLKSYRVFNAAQIEGLPERFHPVEEPDPEVSAGPEPNRAMQGFFDRVGAQVLVAGREASYVPIFDRINIPPLELFERAEEFYAVLGHEHIHWTKPPHRLDRSFGDARFGNTAYAREELVAELGNLFLGQRLGYTPHVIDNSAAYLAGWLRVLKSDKRAIFSVAGHAMRACDYLVERSERGQDRQAA